MNTNLNAPSSLDGETTPETNGPYIPVESLISGKWYAVNTDPRFDSRPAVHVSIQGQAWRHVVAGPFETEAETAQWFDDHDQFGGPCSSALLY